MKHQALLNQLTILKHAHSTQSNSYFKCLPIKQQKQIKKQIKKHSIIPTITSISLLIMLGISFILVIKNQLFS